MIFDPQKIESSWYGHARLGFLIGGTLRVISIIYAGIVAIRRQLYRYGLLKSTRLRVPVIVVGNLIVGGAGKTPLTRALAQQLLAQGWHPGIVSRGYGRQVKGVRAVYKDDSPHFVGDEPLLYAEDSLPVYVGEKRVAAGLALLSANPSVDILIADDGLQHYALERDIELVVFDTRGMGNGQLLPLGPLREDSNRLKNDKVKGWVQQGEYSSLSKDIVDNLPGFKMILMPGQIRSLNSTVPDSKILTLTSFAGQSVVALAGIGYPERFFDMLRSYGICVDGRAFPDHHVFIPEDIPATTLPLLMTEKDAVKCREFSAGHDNWFVVPVTAHLEPPLPLNQWLAEIGAAPMMEKN